MGVCECVGGCVGWVCGWLGGCGCVCVWEGEYVCVHVSPYVTPDTYEANGLLSETVYEPLLQNTTPVILRAHIFF